ncbi:ecto-ADP-ribosyltransferase 5-like [Leptodactylus fuscus]|uniref:ecto-ADP-ribosyltransferase 5-like n=1 Tax=Leptodactylus fuscus TaxID=238119 RepID=UPI003F4F1EB2
MLAVLCKQWLLQMSEDSFDDQYEGCTDKMESKAPEILKKERLQTPEFDIAWKNASALWQQRKLLVGRLPDGFKEEYGIAILTLTFMDLHIFRNLNQAVAWYGQNPENFRFHSLHFYLTRAMTVINPGCEEKTMSTYHYTNHFVPPSDPQATVRLGQIFATLTEIKAEKQSGNPSTFINTCFGVELQKFDPRFKDVLIPINEVFQVTMYDKEQNKITLQSTNRKCSYYNCAYLGGTKSRNCSYRSKSSGEEPKDYDIRQSVTRLENVQGNEQQMLRKTQESTRILRKTSLLLHKYVAPVVQTKPAFLVSGEKDLKISLSEIEIKTVLRSTHGFSSGICSRR